MALSLGTQRQQFEQRTIAVCPRPCLLRPLLRRFDGILAGDHFKGRSTETCRARAAHHLMENRR